jgi:pimeloyl-ACP methyl ester carboxylesterase
MIGNTGFLTNAGVPPPYILVGHSIGGIYARQFARDYPSDVAGLVFVSLSTPPMKSKFGASNVFPILCSSKCKSWPNYSRLGEEGFLPSGVLLK